MRLAKFLAHAGVASRRAAEQLVFGGRVAVGGELVRDPARDVSEDAEVTVDGRPVGTAERRVVHALNKPTGVVSTAHDTHGRRTVVDLVPSRGARLYPVGRLDADSTGLILVTNDGDLAQRLTHPSHGVEKEYLAEVDGGTVAQGRIRALREGIELDDGPTAPAQVSQPSPGVLRITIHEGRNRQVRRMCEAIGHPVRRLVRVRIGTVQDRSLKPGEWRELDTSELKALIADVGSRDPGRFDARDNG
jgi:23S rRNA pseudouridine2605 synthase